MTVDFFLGINPMVYYFLVEIPGYIDPGSMMVILTLLMGAIAGEQGAKYLLELEKSLVS